MVLRKAISTIPPLQFTTTGAKSLKTTIDETMAKPEVQETISKAKDYIEKSANTVADLFKSNKEDDHAE